MTIRSITREEKVDLARHAMQATIDVRFKIGAGLEEPICAYSVSERLGVRVRCVEISMEGIYSQTPLPRILISALRPLVRRHFNCAHELGHHVFGHSSTLDELNETLEAYNNQSPEEFIADSFAGHLLMPVLGIRRAFARRGIDAANGLSSSNTSGSMRVWGLLPCPNNSTNFQLKRFEQTPVERALSCQIHAATSNDLLE